MAQDAPVLICTSGALEGERFRVPDEGLGVGRSDENGIVIVNDGVSRFHARLQYDNGSLWLRDAGSRNGVFVNGGRVVGHRALKVGDVIAVADHTFAVRWDEEDQPTAESPALGSAEEKGRKRWFWPFK